MNIPSFIFFHKFPESYTHSDAFPQFLGVFPTPSLESLVSSSFHPVSIPLAILLNPLQPHLPPAESALVQNYQLGLLPGTCVRYQSTSVHLYPSRLRPTIPHSPTNHSLKLPADLLDSHTAPKPSLCCFSAPSQAGQKCINPCPGACKSQCWVTVLLSDDMAKNSCPFSR